MPKRLTMWCCVVSLAVHTIPVSAQVNLANTKIVPALKSAGNQVDRLFKLGQHVLGAEWKPLARTRESAIFVFNEGAFPGYGIASVWVGVEFAVGQGPARYLSTRDTYQIDCKGYKLAVSKILRFKEHFGDGALIDSYLDDGFVLSTPKPSTVGDALMRRICTHGMQAVDQSIMSKSSS